MRRTVFRVVLTLVVVGIVLGVAIARFQPLAGASRGGVLEGDLVELRVGQEPAVLVGVHDPGAEFIVFQTITNTQNLPVELRAVRLPGTSADVLFSLLDAQVVAGVQGASDLRGDVTLRPVDGYELGRGQRATLVLTFEHLEPCVDVAEDAPFVVTEVIVDFDIFGITRGDPVTLRRAISISAGPGGWTASDPCEPPVR